ncbi:hypothetical protein EDC14_103620 [Hydrogenispora ethanolica]|jgi:hypothetical protein|uniref:Uncharacterized protein n=1 Tax=Hydrogenispora ethanolica TaxID=1082276 RepID=A0A4V2QCH1_HYDET|nr:hypothetical protein [Hydrogenispora ethanolica]TCL60267.1 hypothetical protein EDC14_103620 [Hydrogenispora ethanolica]
MAATLTSSFKITTCWPELSDKQILRIDSFLQTVHYANRTGSLIASGLIKRRIRYLEHNGRARKVEDRVQFEILVGNELPEPLPVLNADLRQDYFIFQPRRPGDNQAVLEHGLRLITRQSERLNEDSLCYSPVWLETIINSGTSEALLQLQIFFPERIQQPKQLEGLIIFQDEQRLPLAAGEIFGTISYRSSQNILQELEYHQPFNFLVKVQQLQNGQRIRFHGEIVDQLWIPTDSAQEWLLNLQLAYRWTVLEKRELCCKPPGRHEPVVKGKTTVLRQKKQMRFSKELTLECELPLNEVVLETYSWESQPMGAGVLVSARLELELVGVRSGQEISFKRVITFEELIIFTESDDQQSLNQHFEIRDELRLRISRFDSDCSLLRLWVTGEYQCNVFEKKLVEIARIARDGQWVAMPIFVEDSSFSLFEEEFMALRMIPQSVERVKVLTLSAEPHPRNGWLVVGGSLKVAVAYTDLQGCFREDLFALTFHKSLLWKKLQRLDQVDLQVRMEYSFFEANLSTLRFQYLVRLDAELYREEEIRVKTLALAERHAAPETSFEDLQEEASDEEYHQPERMKLQPTYRLEMSGEIPLRTGNLREIAESRTHIADFSYQIALNALLIQGKLCGEIDFWDKDGYLRSEPVDYSFWRFLQPEQLPGPTESNRLTPEIRRFRFAPLGSWPWQRRSVHMEIEMELKSIPVTRSEGEKHESFATESSQLPAFDSRRFRSVATYSGISDQAGSLGRDQP